LEKKKSRLLRPRERQEGRLRKRKAWRACVHPKAARMSKEREGGHNVPSEFTTEKKRKERRNPATANIERGVKRGVGKKHGCLDERKKKRREGKRDPPTGGGKKTSGQNFIAMGRRGGKNVGGFWLPDPKERGNRGDAWLAPERVRGETRLKSREASHDQGRRKKEGIGAKA